MEKSTGVLSKNTANLVRENKANKNQGIDVLRGSEIHVNMYVYWEKFVVLLFIQFISGNFRYIK